MRIRCSIGPHEVHFDCVCDRQSGRVDLWVTSITDELRRTMESPEASGRREEHAGALA